MRRRAALGLFVLVLAGCGATPKDDVRGVLKGYERAFARHDYQSLCDDYLAPDLVNGIEERGLPCEAALRPEVSSTKKPVLAIRSIDVHGDRATARVHATAANQPPADETIVLRRIDGKWRITAQDSSGPQPASP